MKPPMCAKNAMFDALSPIMLRIPRRSCSTNHRAIKYFAFIRYIW